MEKACLQSLQRDQVKKEVLSYFRCKAILSKSEIKRINQIQAHKMLLRTLGIHEIEVEAS